MKNLFLLLFIVASCPLFSKGKLLFVSSVQGTLKIDGSKNKITASDKYYTFQLISGVHVVQFFYQNQKVLDTIVQIVDNHQSLIKLAFVVPKVSSIVEENIVLPTTFGTKIICIGNLSVGGTGKTPMTELLIRSLAPSRKVAVLSRGYKRRSKGFVLATAQTTVADIGDVSVFSRGNLWLCPALRSFCQPAGGS